MPIPYAGNSVGVQLPSPAPSIGGAPIVSIPVAGDRGANLWEQPFKTIADWLAFLSAQPASQAYGLLLRVSVLTTGTSLASIAGCRRARVRMVGGGGGGAGCQAFAGNKAGGGGSAGGYAEFFTGTVPVNWTYAIGTAGAAGTNAPTAGGAGGNTTFSDGVTTVTAFGGGGGGTDGQPGNVPAISTNGTINGSGEAGGSGDGNGFSGYGGSCALGGAGGKPLGDVSQTGGITASGLSGDGFGAGGSGGRVVSTTTFSAPGGAGTAGAIILEEWS